MSAVWVLAPLGLVGACVAAVAWGRVGGAMEDLFRVVAEPEPLPDPWQFTDEQVDELFLEATEPIMREYLTRDPREGDQP